MAGKKKLKEKLAPIPRASSRRDSGAAPGRDTAVSAPSAPDLSRIIEPLRPFAVSIETLQFDPANAVKHDEANLDGIRGSLHVYGQRKPVVVNKRTGAIEAGNGQLAAALSLGWTHLAAVYVDDDPATAAGYAIADNRSSDLHTWDRQALDKLLREVSTGNDERLDAMLSELAVEEGIVPGDGSDGNQPGAGGDEFDTTPEAMGPTRCEVGDLWLIDGGRHRLLCGDSTDIATVERLMDGAKAALCFTSPPYAQQRDYGAKITDWDGLMRGVFGNLPMADDGQVLVNLGLVHKDGEWWPYWDGWIEWMRGQEWRRFGLYVWDQGAGMPGDWAGRLAPAFELMFHFNRDSRKPAKSQPCKHAGEVQSKRTFRKSDGSLDGFTHAGRAVQETKIADSVIRVTRQHGTGVHSDHPAVFPVGLPEFVIKSWPGDVYEPFAGSGTTIIAAHRTGCRCFGIEIEPRYCDVILKRCEAEGLTVELAPDASE